jgi:hypothetical protein
MRAMRAWGTRGTRRLEFAQGRSDDVLAADTIAMARRPDVLMQYPTVSGVKRMPRGGVEIRPALDRFVTASTKSEKALVRVPRHRRCGYLGSAKTARSPSCSRGREESFHRSVRRVAAAQVKADLLDFYNRFFARWMSTTDFQRWRTSSVRTRRPRRKFRGAAPSAIATAEFAARLKRGGCGFLDGCGHRPLAQPLTARERATLFTVAKMNAYAPV